MQARCPAALTVSCSTPADFPCSLDDFLAFNKTGETWMASENPSFSPLNLLEAVIGYRPPVPSQTVPDRESRLGNRGDRPSRLSGLKIDWWCQLLYHFSIFILLLFLGAASVGFIRPHQRAHSSLVAFPTIRASSCQSCVPPLGAPLGRSCRGGIEPEDDDDDPKSIATERRLSSHAQAPLGDILLASIDRSVLCLRPPGYVRMRDWTEPFPTTRKWVTLSDLAVARPPSSLVQLPASPTHQSHPSPPPHTSHLPPVVADRPTRNTHTNRRTTTPQDTHTHTIQTRHRSAPQG